VDENKPEKTGLRKVWDESDEEEKFILVIGGAFGLVFLLVILVLIFELLKVLFVPALIGLALYSAGVKYFDWPVPSFVKKFYR
jgi:hypothetical protein